MSKTIKHNSDFLFIYEAINCNPNGDPDQENKPRMDYDTQTNLVTDVRVKRYIRDLFKIEGKEIFVDMEGESKVKMDDRLKAILGRIWDKDEEIKSLINNDELFEAYKKLRDKDAEKTIKKLVSKKPENKEVNLAILAGLVREKFIDIRLFGSAFAVDGFNRSLTGPVQLNWGYSLNKVHLLDSSTIASIMNDGNSTFGKDYRVKYSLLAFHGSINKYAAQKTGMSEEDRTAFRKNIWDGITANPTRTKLNQYPKLYVEIVYKDGFHNGNFGDLRNLISVNPATRNGVQLKDEEVLNINDLEMDFTKLKDVLSNSEMVEEVIIKQAPEIEKLK